MFDKQTAAEIVQLTMATPATKIANIGAIGGGGVALYFGLTANELAAFGGLLIGILSFCAGQFWKWKQHKLLEKRLREVTVSDLAKLE